MKGIKKSKKKYVLYIEGGAIQSKPTDPPKSGYGEVMSYLTKTKGGTASDYEGLMNAIAFHETGAKQRMRPDAVQEVVEGGKAVRSGVGRGLFQFEAGKGAGGITAVNRTYNLFKRNNLEIPSWLSEAYKGDSLDASKLTAEQQKTLFIGNYLEHPKANLGDWQKGKVSTTEFWGKYHHAGGDSTDYDAFNESLKAYKASRK